jgi:hypothetical protein
MAGPKNHSATPNTVIYSPDGKEVHIDRLNAIDLIRTAGYVWKSEDVGRTRAEADGPADPTASVVVIYDKNGGTLETSAANARELVANKTYTWADPNEVKHKVTEAEAAQAVIEAATDLAEAEAALEAEEAPEDESLTGEAMRVSGEANLSKYLDGFSLEALKQIADERFGEKIHHRASKETAIAKIVELEEATQTTT